MGKRIYFQYGVKGIREEARSGFPVIRNTAYLKMRKYRICGYPQNLSNIEVLLHIMKQLTDTNVLSRGKYGRTLVGAKHCTEYRKQRRSFLRSRKACDRKNEQRLYPQNISPGGAADMLAATIFLCQMEERIYTKYEN